MAGRKMQYLYLRVSSNKKSGTWSVWYYTSEGQYILFLGLSLTRDEKEAQKIPFGERIRNGLWKVLLRKR